MFWVCDGKIDCPKGSDEADCPCEVFDMIKCQSDSLASVCVPGQWVCLGHPFCHTGMACVSSHSSEAVDSCLVDEIYCHLNETCLPPEKICDGKFDCQGGEDEMACPGKCKDITNVLPQVGKTDLEPEVFNLLFAASNSKARQNVVFVSTSSNHTRNDQTCLFHPNNITCSSIGKVLQAIMTKDLFWIDNIVLDNYQRSEPELVSLPDILPGKQKYVTITCSSACELTHPIRIYSRKYTDALDLLYTNVNFTGSLKVQNFDLHFKDVYFHNSLLTDLSGRPGEFSHLNIHFSGVLFTTKAPNHECGIILTNTFNLHVYVENTIISNTTIRIQAANVWLVLSNSSFQRSAVHAEAVFSLTAELNNITFEGSFAVGSVSLKLLSLRLNVNIANSLIRNTSGGISVTKQDHGALLSWLRVTVAASEFSGNTKFSGGGALEVVHNFSLSNTLNFVRVRNSTFVENKSLLTKGGAVSVSSLHKDKGDIMPQIILDHCVFLNNWAQNGGGSVYVSANNILNVTQTSFLLNDASFVSHLPVYILGSSLTDIESSTFWTSVDTKENNLVVFHMGSTVDFVRSLKMRVICPAWQKISLSEIFKESDVSESSNLHRFSVRCSTCPQSQFVPSDGAFDLQYSANTTHHVSVSQSTPGASVDSSQCTQCPYGGDCPGNSLRSKPNFWGYKNSGAITFQNCPIGYCCSGNPGSLCSTYNSCDSHRTGTLCGICEHGHSLSLLSNACLDEVTCDDTWVWPVAVVISFFCMCWYTFKDNITELLGKVVRKQTNESTPAKQEEQDNGYFGILAYFVQASAVLNVDLRSGLSSVLDTVLIYANYYVRFLLSVDLTSVSIDLCPQKHLTQAKKVAFSSAFLLGIYFSWGFLYAVLLLFPKAVSIRHKNPTWTNTKVTMIVGLIEIIKYTYGSFASLFFTSLTCVHIDGDYVWFYDGTVQCLSSWQILSSLVGVIYVLPFPFTLHFGLGLVQKDVISGRTLILSCLVPLPFLIYFLTSQRTGSSAVHTSRTNTSQIPEEPVKNTTSELNFAKSKGKCEIVQNQMSTLKLEILSSFQGSYKSGVADNWESVMIMRRLLLTATTLLSNPFLQLGLCTVLCLLFLVHHVYVKPYLHKMSNSIESFSLFLLCCVAVINLSKSNYVQMGMNPIGSNSNIFSMLEIMENMALLLLILSILFGEIKLRVCRF